MFIGMPSWKNNRLGSLVSEPFWQLPIRLCIDGDQTPGRELRFRLSGIGRPTENFLSVAPSNEYSVTVQNPVGEVVDLVKDPLHSRDL
jgi:hypothetical protein